MERLFRRPGSNDWHGRIRLAAYRRKRARYCADKGVSTSWHAMLQAAVDRHLAGEPVKPEAARELPRRLLESFGLVSELSRKRRGTFADNVADYVAELKLSGRDSKYIRTAERWLTVVGEACGWKQLRDLNRDAFVKHLEARKADGTAARTVKNIRATVVAFALWAVGVNRLDVNPLAKLPTIDDTGDQRRNRRALTPDEVARLLKVAGPHELAYRLALGTGLRRSELVRLHWGDVRIDTTTRPRLELRPEATKSKRNDSVPLNTGLVTRLRAARPERCDATTPVFAHVPSFDEWLADCASAGITCYEQRRDIAVLVVGFHSLRVTFVSELERAGVSPRTIQELARHRDYRLTATVYTDKRVLDTAGAVARLPEYETGPERNEARREGTTGQPFTAVGPMDPIRGQLACVPGHLGTPRCACGESQNATNLAGNAQEIGQNEGRGENSPSRTRTYNNPVNSRVLYH